jgi:hypothetical protein
LGPRNLDPLDAGGSFRLLGQPFRSLLRGQRRPAAGRQRGGGLRQPAGPNPGSFSLPPAAPQWRDSGGTAVCPQMSPGPRTPTRPRRKLVSVTCCSPMTNDHSEGVFAPSRCRSPCCGGLNRRKFLSLQAVTSWFGQKWALTGNEGASCDCYQNEGDLRGFGSRQRKGVTACRRNPLFFNYLLARATGLEPATTGSTGR